ncbi:MAG: phage major capsid protein [Clostridiaceae bacterium]|nr:phage major capsid protein [Clostridiaceae bacterium]
MPANLTSFNPILKNQYLGPIREQINSKIELLKRIGTDEESVVGKNFTIPLHHSRNEGIGARSDGGTLPTAGQQGYQDCIVPMRYLYGRIQITGPTIEAAKNNEGAFVRAIESEMKGLSKDLKSDLNRQLFSDGSGRIAICGVTANATTVVVTSTAKLRVGMVVDIIVAATGITGTGATGRTIISIPDATTFVISGAAITTDDTYAVYRTGSRNLEVMGLNGICSATSTLQGLDVITYPWWRANVMLNAGGGNRAISETLLQTAIDTTYTNSDGEVSAIFTTVGVRRAYQVLLQNDRVYQNTKDYDGGWKALDYNGLPFMVDKDCNANTIYLLDEDNLKFYQLADWNWMDRDGAILSRVANADAYEATLYKYCELGCLARNTQTLLGDITEA